jgi:hypothetical protein
MSGGDLRLAIGYFVAICVFAVGSVAVARETAHREIA